MKSLLLICLTVIVSLIDLVVVSYAMKGISPGGPRRATLAATHDTAWGILAKVARDLGVKLHMAGGEVDLVGGCGRLGSSDCLRYLRTRGDNSGRFVLRVQGDRRYLVFIPDGVDRSEWLGRVGDKVMTVAPEDGDVVEAAIRRAWEIAFAQYGFDSGQNFIFRVPAQEANPGSHIEGQYDGACTTAGGGRGRLDVVEGEGAYNGPVAIGEVE